MSANVKFILGRSGSGKTRTVFDAIIERELRGKRSFLIVPDRAAFETERALSEAIGEAGGAGGMMHTTACSFTRLAYRVLSETGGSRAYLSSEGRLMLLRRILDENKTSLTSFARVCSHRGFAEECDGIIMKCKRFSIEPESLYSADVPERLKKKLEDFALVYEKLTERMSERYIDGEDLVNALIERIPLSSLRGSAVFVDAPDMLNAQSLRIIEKLFYSAESVTVTFRADVACREANGGLFLVDLGYYERLTELAREAGCSIETIRLMGNKRQHSAALAHLETTLFSPYAAVFSGDAKQQLELHSSQDRLSEVREAASAIAKAVRGGLRYRDIALAVSDLSGYGEPIRRIFAAANIPVFMDAKRRVASHPVSELILAALRCVEKGFLSEDFIRILKTGLTDFSDSTLEKLENHILKFGLMGRRLTSPEPSVKKADDIKDFDEIERARIAIVEPLLALKAALGEDGSRAASTRVFALYAYLERMRVAERLRDSFDSLKLNAETLAFALENRQIYDTIIELLDQICVIIGDEPIGLARFSAVVHEGLEAYEVGLIPTTLDQVLVGDVSSIHPGEVKFLLVLGANEGRFPTLREDNSIINDRELETMRAAGLRVWESTESMDAAERLRVYSLVCRASECVYLSYCRSSAEPTAPSALIKRIGEIFPHAERSGGMLSPATAESDEAAFIALTDGLRRYIDTGEDRGELAPLYAHFKASEKYAPALDALVKSYYRADALAPLGRETALALYGSSMSGSASRLETFNHCPYRHLLQYGLSLREREVYEIKNNEYGTLIHNALEKLVQSYIELLKADPEAGEAALMELTKEDVENRLSELLPELIEGFNHGILTETATMRARLDSVRRLLRDAGYAVMRQIAGGSFRPYETELRFGGKDGALPALEIKGEGGVVFRISGIIDRLDVFKEKTPEGCRENFRIVDYKTYSSKFNFTDLLNGLKVQLPLYAAAVRAAFEAERNAQTAGLYYLHIHAPSVSDEELRDETVLKNLKLSGPTLADDRVIEASDAEIGSRSSRFISSLRFSEKDGYVGKLLVSPAEMDETLDYAREISKKTLDRIMQGRAEVSPYRHGSDRACRNCPYGSVCGFDTTAGDRYRRISSATPDSFFGRNE